MKEEEEIQLRFTKEGVVEKRQIRSITGEIRWVDVLPLISYDNVKDMGMRFIVESIEPEIEGDVLKALNFRVREYAVLSDKGKGGKITILEGKGRGITINGKFIPCTRQYEILVNTANWLISHGYLTEEDIPASGSGQAILINSKPTKSGGKSMRQPRKLVNGWYIETHFGYEQTKGHAEALVKKFGRGEVDFDISGFP